MKVRMHMLIAVLLVILLSGCRAAVEEQRFSQSVEGLPEAQASLTSWQWAVPYLQQTPRGTPRLFCNHDVH